MLNNVVSKTGLFAKLSQQLIRRKVGTNLIEKRFSGGYGAYREINYDPSRRWINPFFEVSAGVMWAWIMWNFYHHWRHLVGEYVWPEQSSWSDQHLGIPPDDYED